MIKNRIEDFGSIRVQVFGHASLWACGFGHRSGLVVPGWVQPIRAGWGRRELVGATQLDARIPRVRVCVGIAQVAVQKKIDLRTRDVTTNFLIHTWTRDVSHTHV